MLVRVCAVVVSTITLRDDPSPTVNKLSSLSQTIEPSAVCAGEATAGTRRVPFVTVSVLPLPTFKPTDVPLPAALNRASMDDISVLIFVPQVSRLAPTSGRVRLRLVVYESATEASFALIALSNFQQVLKPESKFQKTPIVASMFQMLLFLVPTNTDHLQSYLKHKE